MLKRLGFYLLFFFVAGCIEPYEFLIEESSPGLVIEAMISDKSFNETLAYPSDGRYFTVKLSLTGDVINTRPVPVKGAGIEILANNGEAWSYTEELNGVYTLLDKDFKAYPGIGYKLRVSLSDERVYESEWASLPEVSTPPIGAISFSEVSKDMYVMEDRKWVVRNIAGVQTKISVPANTTGEAIHYRWTFDPIWIYKAPLASVVDKGYICWATDPNYLNTFQLQMDRIGGYDKELFFFKTIRNERIYEKLSVLVRQYAMTPEYFSFWEEMKSRNEGSKLNDTPPFNLKTNYVSLTGDAPVSGFFGVVMEQARKWSFLKDELSYTVENKLRADCLVNYGGPPAEECLDCRAYSFGKAVNVKPAWWE